MDPTPHIVESALLLLAAFLIGCLIGSALKRMFGRGPAQNDTVVVQPGQDANALHATTESDDLRKIKGIGPKLEATLKENGIRTYSQIAAWDAKAIAEMNERLSFRGRIEREKWVSQAKALAKAQEQS